MLSRRKFTKGSSAVGVGLLLPLGFSARGALGQSQVTPLLNARTHPKFVTPLPAPTRVDVATGKTINAQIKEGKQDLGLFGAGGKKLKTTVWGYAFNGASVSYPGATLVARRGVVTNVTWTNKLAETKKPWQSHLFPVDTTIHLALPERLPKFGIPTVTHLHGAHTESASDGGPEAWFTRDFHETGPDFVKRTLTYSNSQEATALWYHDHALGLTRLNNYAGLSGFYFIRDDWEDKLIRWNVLPSGDHEVEMVLQDRMFSSDGELFFPAEPLAQGDPNPSVHPEFFGDFNLVNGVVWPVMQVEARKYRFRLLNGADSRFYVLELRNSRTGGQAQPFLQIGADGGFLPFPIRMTQLTIAPAERADLIVDFSLLPAGTELYLRNFGPEGPFNVPGGDPGDPQAPAATTGQVMKFVVQPMSMSVPQATVDVGTALRTTPVPDLGFSSAGAAYAGTAAADATLAGIKVRQLVLFEGADQYGRTMPILGTVADGSMHWDEPTTEKPRLNQIEIWEIYNTTNDAHPIHVHQIQFRVLNRQRFKGDVVEGAMLRGDARTAGTMQYLRNIRLMGNPRWPNANEFGGKDTVQAYRGEASADGQVARIGEVTRILVKFDLLGGYVWHCHILSHEDHDMMRRLEVIR